MSRESPSRADQMLEGLDLSDVSKATYGSPESTGMGGRDEMKEG